MANPVVIDFIVRGMPDIQRAMRGVEQAVAASERASARAAAQGAKQRVAEANAEAKAKVAAMLKADRWHQQALDKGAAYAARVISKEVKAREAAARQTIQIEERAAREIARIKDRAAKDAERSMARMEASQNRDAAKWVHREERKRFIQERDEMRNRRAFAGAVAGAAAQGVNAGAHRVAGVTMGVANMVGQLGGGFSVSDSVARNAHNAGETADLLNSGINPFSANKVNSKRRDRGEVEGVLDSATTQYGISRESAIGGVRQFTKSTGDLDTGLKMVPKIAELSRATGTDFNAMAGAAGKVALAFDNITDSGEKAEKVMSVLRTVAGQGKAGSVEVSDMAVQMGKLVATSGKFEGDNVENLSKMGMLSQFAAGGGGAWNASSAATSVTSFGQVFSKPARQKAFEAAGVDIFADKGHTKLRAPEQIIADSFEKTKGDQGKVSALFGSAMAQRAIGKFAGYYQGGYTNASGQQLTGKEAVLGAAKEMTGTQMSKSDVTEAAQNRMGELDAKMAVMQENFDKAVREKVIPALMKLVPEFERLVPMLVDLNAQAIPAFVDLIKTVADFADKNKDLIRDIAAHPIGAIMALEVSKSVGGALLGQGIKAIIERSFGDAAMGNIFSKVLSSQMGQAGLIVGAATMAITTGIIAIDNEYKKEDATRDAGRQDAIEAASLTRRMQNGTATDEDRAKAKGLVTKLGADQKAVADNYNDAGTWKKMGRAAAGIVAPEAAAEAEKLEQQQTQAQLKMLSDTMKQLNAAISANTAAQGGKDKPGSGPAGGARTKNLAERN